MKTNGPLKTHKNKWISLILCVSSMTKKEVEEIFGDEPIYFKKSLKS
jgi:hypothetical protein